MFTLLSDQEQLSALLKNLPSGQYQVVSKNLNTIIDSLSVDAKQLLANRRAHGVILPQASATANHDKHALAQLNLEQTVVDLDILTSAINSLCLTEAIVVRGNFINSIELSARETAPSEQHKNEASVEKNNVSPIHLNSVKQRLAQASKSSDEKKAQVKSKLNALLESSKKTSTISKQA